MVRPAGPLLATPPATSSFVNWRSHPLSYGRKKLDARVRFECTLCTALQAVAQPRLVVRTRDDGGCSREAGCAEFFRRSGATANKNCVQDAPECATSARVGRRPPNDESRFHHSAIARVTEKVGGTRPETRTPTARLLRPSPLPIGLGGQEIIGDAYRNRTDLILPARRFVQTATNEIDGFFRQARRTAAAVQVYGKDGQRRMAEKDAISRRGLDDATRSPGRCSATEPTRRNLFAVLCTTTAPAKGEASAKAVLRISAP
jgi:hypothetical protein